MQTNYDTTELTGPAQQGQSQDAVHACAYCDITDHLEGAQPNIWNFSIPGVPDGASRLDTIKALLSIALSTLSNPAPTA